VRQVAPVQRLTAAAVVERRTSATGLWGLDRIDQRLPPLDGRIVTASDGAGVNAYVVDSGIRAGQEQFGGRLLSGVSVVGDGRGTEDCGGHGTRVAGGIAGSQTGVAPAMWLTPVRVIDCAGNGDSASVIAGLDWVVASPHTALKQSSEAATQRLLAAIANPHARVHFSGPEGTERILERANDELPPEPKEIKPHPYGVELGRLVTMLQEHPKITLAQFLTQSFSRVSHGTAKRICEIAKLSTRVTTGKLGRGEADALFKAIQETKIPPPATDCVVPIGEQRLLAGIRQVVPGEFFTAATRPPGVSRGNPFVIEASLAYGGGPARRKCRSRRSRRSPARATPAA
jgi:hypothetical protein